MPETRRTLFGQEITMKHLSLRVYAYFIAFALVAWTMCALVTCMASH